MPDDRNATDGGRTVEDAASRTPPAPDHGEAGASLAADDVPELGRVLVTGGGGFIGHHLVAALNRRNDVHVIDTFENGSLCRMPADVTAVEGDVRNRTLVSELLRDADAVVHLAGQVSVDRSFESPLESHATNVEATIQLLEAARREDARVVFASSAAVYGDPERVPVGEGDPKTPSSPYGVEKLAADHYVRVYAERYDLPAVVLRYFNVYGPGASAGVIDAFARRAVAGEPLVVHGDGEQTRDFVHVADVLRATLAATETEATGRAINVGTGERHTIREVAELVRDRVRADPPIEHADPRPGDVRHSCADVDRARSLLDYEPRVALSEGVDSALESVAAVDDRAGD